MKSTLFFSAVIGTFALVVHGVGGMAVPVDAAVINPLDHQAPRVERSITLTPTTKRTCWEAINGQIQCNSPVAVSPGSSSPSTDGGSGTSTMDDGTPMTSGADDDGSAAADDGVGGDDNPTTCVHTADGFIRCGDVVGKRDDGDVGSGEDDVDVDGAEWDDGVERGHEEDSGVRVKLLARAREGMSA
ncbi:MAG: hypothetical protein LQ346_005069 [Caloplaca aetnensis]|nr:MAG: hypothetical protein LQ346_005069 [Caloplaca aetnensis]